MSTITDPEQNAISETLERDLPSLACRAAVELDNLGLGRSSGLESVRKLSLSLKKSLPEVADFASPSSLFDPTMAIVVNGAISDTKQAEPIRQMAELLGETKNITDRLENLLQDPDEFCRTSLDQVKELRSFCLALSKRAFGFKRPRQSRTPQHPFRR